jgi:hypothetical protein
LGTIWEHRYRFKVEVAGGTMRFWANTDQTGDSLLLEIPAGQYSVPFNLEQHGYAPGSNGRIMLLQSDRGCSYYDNLVVTRETTAPPVCADDNDCSEPYMTDDCTVGIWHFDEGAGSVTADASGHNQDGDVLGPDWISSGRFADALNFGDGDSVRVVLNQTGFITGSHTVEAWIYPTSIGTQQTVLSLYGIGDQIPLYLRTDGRVSFRVVNNTHLALQTEVFSTTVLEANTRWYHVAGRWDDDSHKLSMFVDGVMEAEIDVPWSPTPLSSATLEQGLDRTVSSQRSRQFFPGLYRRGPNFQYRPRLQSMRPGTNRES